jgi:exosome complex exonuclease DIS3/RRP44
MKIFSNGFVVLVPRFGIEGLIRLRDLAEPEPESEFDAETYTLTTSGSRPLKVELFQKVKVRVHDEKDEATGKRGVKMELISA